MRVFFAVSCPWSPICVLSSFFSMQKPAAAPSGLVDGHHLGTASDAVVVSVFPGRVDPRMTSISGTGFDECTAGTQVGKRKASAFSMPKPVTVRLALCREPSRTPLSDKLDKGQRLASYFPRPKRDDTDAILTAILVSGPSDTVSQFNSSPVQTCIRRQNHVFLLGSKGMVKRGMI